MHFQNCLPMFDSKKTLRKEENIDENDFLIYNQNIYI